MRHKYLDEIEIEERPQVKEEKDLFDSLVLIAANDGDAYRSRDAKGAAKRAADQYLSFFMSDLRADLRSEIPKVAAEMKKRWRQVDADARRNSR